MINIKLFVYSIQLTQCSWWIYHSYWNEENKDIPLRITACLIILFRTLEMILTHSQKRKYILSYRCCHFLGNIALTEAIMNFASIMNYNKVVNIIILLNNINQNQQFKVLHNQFQLALIINYLIFRYILDIILFDDRYLFLEPFICLILMNLYFCPRVFSQRLVDTHSINRQEVLSQNITNTSQSFFQNIINIFPTGIIMVNHLKQVEYMNLRCKRLLEVETQEEVLSLINTAYRVHNSSKQNIFSQPKNNLDFLDSFFRHQVNYPLKQQDDLEINRSEMTFSFAYRINYEFKSPSSNKIKQIRIKIISGFSSSVLNNSQHESTKKEVLLFILIKDISKQQKLKKLESELISQNSLLRSFSHELRTPLNCSIQMLGLAKDSANQEQLYFIDIAVTQNMLLMYQINDILDFAAFQCHQFFYQWKTFQLKEILDDIEQLYNYQCQSKQIILRFQCDEKFISQEIISDKPRIMQVMVNLVNNSLKFTQQNGQITIQVEPDSHQLVQLTVIDNGTGIKQEKLEKISQQNIERSELQGFGLGINISSRIVFGLGGSALEITSNYGKGTKISFKILNRSIMNDSFLEQEQEFSPIFVGSNLPIQYIGNNKVDGNEMQNIFIQSSSSEDGQNNRNAFDDIDNFMEGSLGISDSHQESHIKMQPKFLHAHALGGYLDKQNCECCDILIVDDVPGNQMALQSMLKKLQLRADKAYDGERAIEEVKKKLNCCGSQYKLILMDIEMPNMDGFQATQEILKIYQTNIIMCSAYDNKEIIEEAKQAGMCEFLIKPIHSKDIQRLITKYLS